MESNDAHWLAAWVDGEGCCQIGRYMKDGYVCYNCNIAKYKLGVCPHKEGA